MVLAFLLCLFSCTKRQEMTRLSINMAEVNLMCGESVILSAEISPKSSGNTIRWHSLKPDVANVSENGVVTGVDEGQAIIIASCGALQKGCVVTVYKQVKGALFIKEDGDGRGTSWFDAAGPDVLFSTLSTDWREYDNIYVAQGRYSYGKESTFAMDIKEGVLNIRGGFSRESRGTDTSHANPNYYQTFFSTSMELVGDLSGTANFDGIGFADCNSEGLGAGLMCNAVGATVTFKDCIFENNVTSSHGGAMAVLAGNVYFNSCTFVANKATTSIASNKKDSNEAVYVASHGGAVYAQGSDTHLYFSSCSFLENEAFFAADLALRDGANAWFYRSSFVGGKAYAMNYFGNFYGRSIDADALPDGARGELGLCNCTITHTSSVYTDNGGLPLVSTTSYDCILCLNTLHDGSVASFRNNVRAEMADDDHIWIIGNLFYNPQYNAINLNSKSIQHGYYNILNSGKNAYATLAATDSKVDAEDFLNITFQNEKNVYSWSLDEDLHPVTRPSAGDVAVLMESNASSFDRWLKVAGDGNPYLYDQTGALRNASSLNPGSWESGIDDNNEQTK